MQVILTSVSGPSSGTRFTVPQGTVARVGSTQWADFSVPADQEMSDIHFEIEFLAHGCRIRTAPPAVTMVNGKPVKESLLRNGDQITVGQTTFLAEVPDIEAAEVEPATQATAQSAPTEESSQPDGADAPSSAADLCRGVDLSEQALPLLQEQQQPEEFYDLLLQQDLLADAVKLLACWLSKEKAVAWAADCVAGVLGESLPPASRDALQAARNWTEDPSEENRRLAEQAAEKSQFEGPASWVALGSFWSGGSLAPADLPEVPPSDELTSQAVSAALVMAATQDDPQDADGRYREFAQQGRARVDQPDA